MSSVVTFLILLLIATAILVIACIAVYRSRSRRSMTTIKLQTDNGNFRTMEIQLHNVVCSK